MLTIPASVNQIVMENSDEEEALSQFIQPETLDGDNGDNWDNQYDCKKCDKKVDAQKGLKFTEFPYLLTLQLKRFYFDSERVKPFFC